MKLETPEGSLDRYNSNCDETIADAISLYYRGSSMVIGNSPKPRSMCSAPATCSKPSSAPRITSAASPIGIEAAKTVNMAWVHVPGPTER